MNPTLTLGPFVEFWNPVLYDCFDPSSTILSEQYWPNHLESFWCFLSEVFPVSQGINYQEWEFWEKLNIFEQIADKICIWNYVFVFKY